MYKKLYLETKYFMYIILNYMFLGLILIITSCGKKVPDQVCEDILVRIGDKTISVEEFIRRAENTIRPPYCNGDSYFHKKIVLNSLIAEKMMALESDKDNELSRNEQFQDYLRGRKEQAMRQWLYDHDFFKKVKLDTNEIKKVYKCAGRNYKIAYYTIKDNAIANMVKRKLLQGRTFTDVLRELGGDEKIPQREVNWNAEEHETIHTALFSEPLEKNQVIGPLRIEENYYTVIKILDWTDRIAISDSDIRQRWNHVTERLKKKHATVQYRQYVSKIMRGKRVEFSRDTFYKLADIFGKLYFKSRKEKKVAFKQRLWQKDKNEINPDDIGDNVEKIIDFSLLQIDGEILTVREFEKELRYHPLVFRKKRIKRIEFAEQFKLAVVDMIRDKYITEEAYKKKYDKVNIVERNVSMWRDYLSALYHRNQYLESIGKNENFNKDYSRIIEQDLNPYIDSLQQKYNDVIEINRDRFEKIQLTRIDMFVTQHNVPFSIVVPGFPKLTTDNKLDYGKIME